ncbi:MAG TPA: hypothetical protein VK959_08640 [Methylophilaceae bacterium]|jgi:hypothetical protein|nr:hypothetical protein [Methylophilaceae bacterium]
MKGLQRAFIPACVRICHYPLASGTAKSVFSSVPGMPLNSPGMGEMKKGTLTVYTIPRAEETPKVFSVE